MWQGRSSGIPCRPLCAARDPCLPFNLEAKFAKRIIVNVPGFHLGKVVRNGQLAQKAVLKVADAVRDVVKIG